MEIFIGSWLASKKYLSSSKIVSRPLDVRAYSQSVASTGAVAVGFGSSGLLRVSGRRPFEFAGLAIPDRSTVATDFTVRFERSDIFALGVDAETETLGTRDASIGRLDRLLIILCFRYGTLYFVSFVDSQGGNGDDFDATYGDLSVMVLCRICGFVLLFGRRLNEHG